MLRIGQVETTATSDGLYTDGSVAGGVAATRLRAAAFNALQEELAHIVEEGGFALSIDDTTQVLKALKELFLSRSNPFGDIASGGPDAIATALSNLGLGEGSALPVGVPIPWPSAMPPTGWLKCNGATFDKAKYPSLAIAYPSGILPDLRGEFIRGWDDGRGVDSGRTILSSQHGSLVVGDDGISSINPFVINNLSDISVWGYDQKPSGLPSNLYTIRVTPVSGATNTDTGGMIAMSRPRNIAYNYIVRAA